MYTLILNNCITTKRVRQILLAFCHSVSDIIWH